MSPSAFLRTLAVLLMAGAVSGRPVRAQCLAGWADGFGPIEGYVKALALYDDGTGPKLVAGGRFTRSGGVGLSHVAVWNGLAWRPIGGGFAGLSLPATPLGTEVLALTAFDDGTGPALYAGGNFLTAGGVVVNGVAKWNGSTWLPLGSGIAGYVRTLAVYDDGSGPALYAGGFFTSAGGTPAASVAKWNGAFWSPLGSGLGGSFCLNGGGANAMAAFDDGTGPSLFVTGYFATAGGLTCNAIAKWNGAAWSLVGNGLAQVPGFYPCGYGTALTVFDDGAGPALFVGGSFHSTWGAPTYSIARWSSLGWSTPNLTGLLPGALTSLAVHDDGTGPALYAAGQGVAKRTGSSGWINLGAPSNQVSAIASFPPGGGSASLAAGGLSTNPPAPISPFVAKWDGAAWGAIGAGLRHSAGGLNNSAPAYVTFDDGTGPAAIVGGSFQSAGDISALRIARRRGDQWTPLGTGFNNPVVALTVFDAGIGPELYAFGLFSAAGPTGVNGVARFQGGTWVPVGGGVGPAGAYAAVVYDPGSGAALYAGGAFTTAGGAPANRIARWNGAAWSTLGSGVSGGSPANPTSVAALAAADLGAGPKLFAGGSFGMAGGVAASSLAAWNGSAWSGVGGGVSGGGFYGPTVSSLVIHDDGTGPSLFVAGDFTAAGGVAAQNIAKWNGSGWSPLGGGLGSSSTPPRLAVYDDGTGPALYAVGTFQTAGGQPIPFMARWNGSSWSQVGGGVNSSCFGIGVANDGSGPALFVGGVSTLAGNTVVQGIAKWGPMRPAVSASQPTGPGGAVIVSDLGLVAGREYANVFSFDICAGGAGSGPYLGLCAQDVGTLIAQVLLPPGTEPFRILAGGIASEFGGYPAPPGLVCDFLCLDVTGGMIGCVSPVVRYVVQ